MIVDFNVDQNVREGGKKRFRKTGYSSAKSAGM